MVQLSIIIPAIADAAALEETLVSALSHRPDDCEIVVPHGANYDDPYGVSDEVIFLELPRRSTGGQLISQAIDTCLGEIVHLLTPGCQVRESWCDAALRQFNADDVASVTPVLVEHFGHGEAIVGLRRGFAGRRMVARHVNASAIGPTHVAGFYRREALDAVGGWPAQLSLPYADLDIALSLAEAGYEAATAPNCTIACSAIDRKIIRAMKRARDQERLFWRHCGGSFTSLAHPMIATAQCLLAGNPLRMIGAGLGKMLSSFDIAPGRWHQQLVRDAAQSRRRAQEADVESDQASADLTAPHRKAA